VTRTAESVRNPNASDWLEAPITDPGHFHTAASAPGAGGGSTVDGTTIVDVAGVLSVGAIAESQVTGLITSLGALAPINNAALTGTPTAPTVGLVSDASTKIATTAFVQAAIAASVPSVDGTTIVSTGGTLSVGVIPESKVTNLTTDLGARLQTANNLSELTGTASTARANLGLGTAALLASSAVLQAANNLTDVASASAALNALHGAPLISPPLTGVPTAPTATFGTNNFQIATTQFVQTAVLSAGAGSGVIARLPRYYPADYGTWTPENPANLYPSNAAAHVTANTAALAACFSAATSSATGGVIVLGPGHYAVDWYGAGLSTTLANLFIEGSGLGVTWLWHMDPNNHGPAPLISVNIQDGTYWSGSGTVFDPRPDQQNYPATSIRGVSIDGTWAPAGSKGISYGPGVFGHFNVWVLNYQGYNAPSPGAPTSGISGTVTTIHVTNSVSVADGQRILVTQTGQNPQLFMVQGPYVGTAIPVYSQAILQTFTTAATVTIHAEPSKDMEIVAGYPGSTSGTVNNGGWCEDTILEPGCRFDQSPIGLDVLTATNNSFQGTSLGRLYFRPLAAGNIGCRVGAKRNYIVNAVISGGSITWYFARPTFISSSVGSMTVTGCTASGNTSFNGTFTITSGSTYTNTVVTNQGGASGTFDLTGDAVTCYMMVGALFYQTYFNAECAITTAPVSLNSNLGGGLTSGSTYSQLSIGAGGLSQAVYDGQPVRLEQTIGGVTYDQVVIARATDGSGVQAAAATTLHTESFIARASFTTSATVYLVIVGVMAGTDPADPTHWNGEIVLTGEDSNHGNCLLFARQSVVAATTGIIDTQINAQAGKATPFVQVQAAAWRHTGRSAFGEGGTGFFPLYYIDDAGIAGGTLFQVRQSAATTSAHGLYFRTHPAGTETQTGMAILVQDGGTAASTTAIDRVGTANFVNGLGVGSPAAPNGSGVLQQGSVPFWVDASGNILAAASITSQGNLTLGASATISVSSGTLQVNGLNLGGAQILNVGNGTGGTDAINYAQITSGDLGFVSGNLVVQSIEPANVSAKTGTGNLVFNSSPSLTGPTITAGGLTVDTSSAFLDTSVATSGTANTFQTSTVLTGINTLFTDGSITSGQVVKITSSSLTSGNLLDMVHSASAATGNAIVLNMATAGGSFTGSPFVYQKGSTSVAILTNLGAWRYVSQTITVSANAGTGFSSAGLQTFTNSSAATMTITLPTGGGDGTVTIVRVLDFSAASQTITWVNTEGSPPTTSNGSTTVALHVAFMYNSGTSKWHHLYHS